MSLEAFANLATIVSALVVALSLPPIIISVRQNARSQRAAVVDSLAAAIVGLNQPATENPAMGLALRSTLADWYAASREDRVVSHYFLFGYFKLHENAYYQHKAGILDDDLWGGWQQSLLKYFHSRGVKDVWWPNRRNAYSKSFQTFLDLSDPPETLGDLGELFDDTAANTAE